jgi:16S rRNA (cytosine1402-N4)-methyltransferase
MPYEHEPVLLTEVLRLADLQPGDHVIDGTLGGGGYTAAFSKAVGSKGKVLAIDLDEAALENFKAKKLKNVTTAHGNFRDVNEIGVKHNFVDISAIVADIGLSSFHIDSSGRGISFQKKELLDMRFDVRQDTTAAFILNNKSEQEIRQLFQKYGEEKFSGQIARKIVQKRSEQPLKYTTDLTDVIEAALPKPIKHKWTDSARRIFQALRIAVNHELDNLETFLPNAFDILAPDGKLIVVTFHSLEDRIVKQYFQGLAKGCVCPIDFPICQCGKNPQAKILTKKPITASDAELEKNSRSKSAKLRAIQKIQ